MSAFKNGPEELAKILSYIGLNEGSETFKIVCPFHEDINPSMIVNLIEGSFFCFGCLKTGKAFDFFRYLHQDLDDIQCLKKYFRTLKMKKLSGVKVIKSTSSKQNTISSKRFKNESIQYYRGLSSTNWNEYSPEAKYLLDRGLKPEILNAHGAKININDHYPIIFPILDNWMFKGWVCRTTSRQIEAKRKYLYNKGFKRTDCLAGVYQASTVVLVEGYIDFLKARQLGLKNVAAILGWKISNNQIEKLKQAGVKNIISALDNDTCGDKGSLYLEKFFNVVRFIYPKDCKDFGDLNLKQFEKSYIKTKRKIKEAQKWD